MSASSHQARHLPSLASACALMALVAACGSGPARRAQADGPLANLPPHLDQRPDAQPRVEAPRVGGANKPYEVGGRSFVPMTSDLPFSETGLASWYGRKYHGLPTASGEPYDMFAMTAAHPTLPIPSYAVVSNPANGREVVVRVNDRGPFAEGRVIDLSYTAALKLGLLAGVAPVRLKRLTNDDIRRGWKAVEDPAPVLPTPNVDATPQTPPVDPSTPKPRADPALLLPADNALPGDSLASAVGVAGWWLQLGSFSTRDAAAQFQLHLQRELAPTVTMVAVFEEDARFRVQTGPYVTRSAARAAAEGVRGQLGVAPLVVERR
jgi:rare lipoprotein A